VWSAGFGHIRCEDNAPEHTVGHLTSLALYYS
jgi:hypothetical protein